MASPKVFISYAWENTDHKIWVKQLAIRLRKDGVEAVLDQWELAPGDQLSTFMERSVRTSDFVLIVCTPTYRNKSDNRTGGVGYEGDVMTAEVVNGTDRRKFIPLLRSDTWKQAAPSWLSASYYIELRGEPYSEDNYNDLLNTVLDRRETAPEVVNKHTFVSAPATSIYPARRDAGKVAACKFHGNNLSISSAVFAAGRCSSTWRSHV